MASQRSSSRKPKPKPNPKAQPQPFAGQKRTNVHLNAPIPSAESSAESSAKRTKTSPKCENSYTQLRLNVNPVQDAHASQIVYKPQPVCVPADLTPLTSSIALNRVFFGMFILDFAGLIFPEYYFKSMKKKYMQLKSEYDACFDRERLQQLVAAAALNSISERFKMSMKVYALALNRIFDALKKVGIICIVSNTNVQAVTDLCKTYLPELNLDNVIIEPAREQFEHLNPTNPLMWKYNAIRALLIRYQSPREMIIFCKDHFASFYERTLSNFSFHLKVITVHDKFQILPMRQQLAYIENIIPVVNATPGNNCWRIEINKATITDSDECDAATKPDISSFTFESTSKSAFSLVSKY